MSRLFFLLLLIEDQRISLHSVKNSHLTQGSKEKGGRDLETFIGCDGSDLGENILDLIVELGVDLLGPKVLEKSMIRLGSSVVFLIYTPCC